MVKDILPLLGYIGRAAQIQVKSWVTPGNRAGTVEGLR